MAEAIGVTQTPSQLEFEQSMVSITETRRKTCLRCKILQSITNFHKNSAKKDGYANYCKTCISIAAKAKRNQSEKEGKPLMEVFDGPTDVIKPVGEIFREQGREQGREQEILDLIESLFPDGIQPKQYRGMVKTIKLILKSEG